MSMDIKYRKVFAEVLDVLEYTDRTLVRKIPREFMEFLRQNADMTHGVIFDSSKKLREQAISEEAKEILAMIYEDYMNKTKMQNNMKESTNEKLLKIFKNKIGGEK